VAQRLAKALGIRVFTIPSTVKKEQ